MLPSSVRTPSSPFYSLTNASRDLVFNNAEESLQDGSHLYSTQHPTAHTVRAAINLEGSFFLSFPVPLSLTLAPTAAGTTGRDMLFQATSEQMLEAYSHVPRPFGSVVANEVFSSGVIMSECVPSSFLLCIARS